MHSLKAKFLFPATLVCALTFTACGSDSSSGSDSTSTDSRRISVDEANRTLTIYSEGTTSACLYDGDGEYSWNDSYRKVSGKTTYSYLFIGDTLIIVDSYDEGGIVFVGGDRGTLYGTWTLLDDCEYEYGNIDCDDNRYGTITYVLQFTFSKIAISFKYKLLVDDYMNSEWMTEFYSGLSRKYFDFSRIGFFYADSANVAAAIQSAGVEILSQTKTSVSFSFNGKPVSLQLNLQDFAYGDVHYTVEVQSEADHCALDVEMTTNITKSLCSAENDDYLEWYEIENGDSTDYVVDGYYRDNRGEFENCLHNMFFLSSSDGGVSLLKKAVAEKKDRTIKKKTARFLGRLQKFAD